MLCSPRIVSEKLREIHTIEKFDFHKSIIHSQIIQFSFNVYLYKYAKIRLTYTHNDHTQMIAPNQRFSEGLHEPLQLLQS